MKIYEILKRENINKIFKDNKGDTWRVITHNDNLILVMDNEGSSHINIVNFYYLDEIFELNFEAIFFKQENILIDEGYKFDTTEQTEYIKEIQKVSKFKLEK
ncbi:hypothetical protein [Clostridium botulinum]|uniref:hypothetical protein n=1 Tax=Clostridium botulinum TaxID=1491 RepID=UPI0004D0267A|nr:hypothetical protein [Clostridium botulinum]MBY6773670.1 hypothetical protein [Clostridium botulinum]MBY6864288.1 hypothetical protein [Clostridium botulinum]MBY6984834.1 hypothetical protein [Clostridium botulinum]NFP26146.1 hypothetical protein [Clostridium botulinum]